MSSAAPVGDVEYWTLERVLADVEDGDARGWRGEAVWLWQHRSAELARLLGDVAVNGIVDAIDIAWTGDRWRMWDGHHRVIVAGALCIRQISVRMHIEDALDGHVVDAAFVDGDDGP